MFETTGSLNIVYLLSFGTFDDLVLYLMFVSCVLQPRMPLPGGKEMEKTPSSETPGGTRLGRNGCSK